MWATKTSRECWYCQQTLKLSEKGFWKHMELCKNKQPETMGRGQWRFSRVVKGQTTEQSGDAVSNISVPEIIVDDIIQPVKHDPPEDMHPLPSKRIRKAPSMYRDFLPSVKTASELGPISHIENARDFQVTVDTLPPEPLVDTRRPFTTEPDALGMIREYLDIPTSNPDTPIQRPPTVEYESSFMARVWASMKAPFNNITNFRLTYWANSGSNNKSDAETNRLVKEVLGAPDYNYEDIKDFNLNRSNAAFDACIQRSKLVNDRWKKTTVKIRVPVEGLKHKNEKQSPLIEVPGLHYQSLVDTITEALQGDTAGELHYTPYKEYWKPTDDSEPQRVYGEDYTSDALLQMHEDLQTSVSHEDEIENIVLPLMLASDATHLASFGSASLWPLYLFLGSHSKYTRAKPTSGTGQHLAYIPKLPQNIQDLYKAVAGFLATAAVLTHLKRELMQAVLEIVLLNPEFLEAYAKGIVVLCFDNVRRRFFPRFLTYSGDYPEKCLIALIKALSRFPCPMCYIDIADIHELGTLKDERRRNKIRVDDAQTRKAIETARARVFKGASVGSSRVQANLNTLGSLLPIRNAFSSLLDKNFNFYTLFVPDLLHEFEIGVWKSIFTHLMRILVAQGGSAINDLNKRYRSIPTFATIRKFSNNASSMTKLAARDFEDLLQCAYPVFEDLLPRPHNKHVLDLLFTLATWHALAKLRLHTETTVALLENETKYLGRQVRKFKKHTCDLYDTKELPAETAARGRRKAALVKKGIQTDAVDKAHKTKRKTLNINTYKFHSLGKYAQAIRRFGTTDSYSTQTGELMHRRAKAIYGRTNKKDAVEQISKQEERQRFLAKMALYIERIENASKTQEGSGQQPTTEVKSYQISTSTKQSKDICTWLREHQNDPALVGFLPNLRTFILPHLRHGRDATKVIIKQDRIFAHLTLSINYTTYDIHQGNDTINVKTHPDIMIYRRAESDTEHPYDYARIIGIFHVDAAYLNPASQNTVYSRVEFLWIRRFDYISEEGGPFATRQLPSLKLCDMLDSSAFDFISPEQVVRGIHLIPNFAIGQQEQRDSVCRITQQDDTYRFFYINIFADRDLFMRFRGGGIGHKDTRFFDERLLAQQNDNDLEDEDNEGDAVTADEEEDQSDTDTDLSSEPEPEAEYSEDDEFYGYTDL